MNGIGATGGGGGGGVAMLNSGSSPGDDVVTAVQRLNSAIRVARNAGWAVNVNLVSQHVQVVRSLADTNPEMCPAVEATISKQIGPIT